MRRGCLLFFSSGDNKATFCKEQGNALDRQDYSKQDAYTAKQNTMVLLLNLLKCNHGLKLAEFGRPIQLERYERTFVV